MHPYYLLYFCTAILERNPTIGMYKYLLIILFPLFFSCNNQQKKPVERNENIEFKAALQGMWMDENTESPVLQIKGDSIYYFDVAHSMHSSINVSTPPAMGYRPVSSEGFF